MSPHGRLILGAAGSQRFLVRGKHMHSASFTSNQLVSPASGRMTSAGDDQSLDFRSDRQPAPKARILSSPFSSAHCAELAASQFGISVPGAPMLQERTVENQFSESNFIRESPKRLDFSAYHREPCYDFFAAGLAQLTRESPVRKDDCGLTFKCQTCSWGNTELALTFTGCDLKGKPKAVNEIGVQLLDAYPVDWRCTQKLADKKAFADSLLRSIIGHANYADLKLQFEATEPSQHVLLLGALNEDTTFNIKLQVTVRFPNGVPVSPGTVPQELLAFVTTDNLAQSSWCDGAFLSTPATDIIYPSAFERGAVLRGKNCQGELVGYFDTQARSGCSAVLQCPVFQCKPERLLSAQPPLRSDCRNAVRLMVTPAIVFNAPLTKQNPGSREVMYYGASVAPRQTVHCPGLGEVNIKTAPTMGELRLLPSTLIDVITTNPLAAIS